MPVPVLLFAWKLGCALGGTVPINGVTTLAGAALTIPIGVTPAGAGHINVCVVSTALIAPIPDRERTARAKVGMVIVVVDPIRMTPPEDKPSIDVI